MKIYHSWSFEVDAERGIAENLNIFIQTENVTHRENVKNPKEIVEFLNKEAKNLMKKLKRFTEKSDLTNKDVTNEKGNSENRRIADSNGIAAGPSRRVGRRGSDGK